MILLPPASWRVLLGWAVIVLTLIGVGAIVRRACRPASADAAAPLFDFWLGWAALTIVLEAWHFLLPIDERAGAVLVALGLLGIVSEAGRPWRTLARSAAEHPLALLAIAVIAAWLSRQCLGGARHGDSGFYHVPTIAWLVSFPAVPGIVNLFPFLAYNQSFFLYAAVLDGGPFAHRAHHLANGVLVLMLFARGILGCARTADRRAPSPADVYYALMLPGIAGIAFDIVLTSPSPDIAVFALEAVLCGMLVEHLWTPGRSAAWLAPACALVAGVGVTVKMSFGGLTGAALALLFVLAVGRAPALGTTRGRAALAVVGPAALAIVPWIVHGIVLSGYPLYPSPFFPLPLPWRAPLEATIAQAEAIRSWNAPTGIWALAFRNPRWFARALDNLGWTRWDVLLPLALALLTVPIGFVRRLRRRGVPDGALPLLVLVPTLGGLAFSVVSAPQARFAGALPWALAAAGVLLALGPADLAARRRVRAALVAASVAATALHLRDGPLLRRDLVDFEPQPRPSVNDVQLATGLTVKVPDATRHCWDAPPPCTPMPNRALRLRREGDLASGFVLDPAIEPGPP